MSCVQFMHNLLCFMHTNCAYDYHYAGIAIGIVTADCAPVLFADAEAGVVGGAHAGWRGALSGVLEATLSAMEALGADRRRIAAAVGPCIGQASYEVAADLRDAVVALDRYFDSSARRVVLTADLVRQVAGQARQVSLPRPDETLAALAAAQAGR